MKKNTHINLINRMSIWAVVVAAVLMIPFLTQAPWTSGDYIFAGIVLFGFASLYEFITKNMASRMHRFVVGLSILGAIGLVVAWAATGP